MVRRVRGERLERRAEREPQDVREERGLGGLDPRGAPLREEAREAAEIAVPEPLRERRREREGERQGDHSQPPTVREASRPGEIVCVLAGLERQRDRDVHLGDGAPPEAREETRAGGERGRHGTVGEEEPRRGDALEIEVDDRGGGDGEHLPVAEAPAPAGGEKRPGTVRVRDEPGRVAHLARGGAEA